MGRRSIRGLLVTGMLVLGLTSCVTLERSSVSSSGVEGNGASVSPSLSGNGRYVAFTSAADNLVAGDTNGATDVFVRDHQTRTTTLVSVPTGGGVAGGDSREASISGDGRLVAFTSAAANLVPGDINGGTDVFVRDLASGTTTRVSRDGDQVALRSDSGRLSADGRYIVFFERGDLPSTGLTLSSIVTVELATGTRQVIASTTIQPPILGNPVGPLSISDDGSVVTYGTIATHSLGISFSSVQVWHRASGTSTFVASATSPNIVRSGAVSGDGEHVLFSSTLDHVPESDACVEPELGSTVLPPECDSDVFVWTSTDGTYERLTPAAGTPSQAHVAISLGDGGAVALFGTTAGSRTSLSVHDRTTGRTSVVGRTSDLRAALSGDGRLVALATDAPMGSGDTNGVSDVYVRRSVAPAATSAAPSSVERGTTSSVTIEGYRLEAGTSVLARGSGVSFSSVQVVDSTTLTVQATVAADAPLGPMDLIVSTPGLFPGSSVGSALTTCGGCLDIVG